MTFNRLRAMKVAPTATSDFTFYNVHGRPKLRVRPGGMANPRYMDAMFNKSKGIARRLRSGEMSMSLIAETRDIDLELYPKMIVVGWEDETVLDDEDNPAPFSPENVSDFLSALPPEEFDDLRAHCSDISNFRELADDDVAAVVGN